MGRHHSQPTLSLLNSHSLSGNVLEGRKATNQSQFSLGRPLGRLEIYGNDRTLCADTREVATEHPGCPRSHHLQPDQEASEDGWEEISTGERGRCQGKVVAQSCMQTNWRRSSRSRSRGSSPSHNPDQTVVQVQRRQHAKLPNPITGLKDFGSHVAGGFSKLTGLGRGATAKVSQTLFPWLSSHSTEERAATAPSQHSALPLLPPVYVPVSPEQRAEDSQVLVQRVPAPPLPIFVPEPVQHTALPLPPYPVHDTHPPTNPPPTESASASLLFGIAPLINRLLAKNLPRPERTSDLRPKVSNVVSRSLTKARPITARQDVIPSTLRNVMYYIPSPDLSAGVERNVPQLLEERSDAEDLEVVYSRPSLDQDEGFRPSIEVSRPRIDNFVRPDLAIGTNIEIDLSSGGSNEGDFDAWERAKILEKTLRQQIEEEAKVVRSIERGRRIELAPTDTLVFDLSQDWGTRIADEVPTLACHTHCMGRLQPA